MNQLIRTILLSGACIISLTCQASITVGGTRLIYNASENEASLPVSNTQDGVPYLIQSWVELSENSEGQVPFIVTPPLFRLDAGHENTLRIIYTGEKKLPENRESVFWLNVKSIPSMTRSDENRLLIAVKTRMKLFYRPALLASELAGEAWEKLKFEPRGEHLLIINPTPFYVSLYSLKVGDKSISQPPMISPFSSETVAGIGKQVTWKAINDFGGVTTEKRQVLK
ncbi:MULTISPECIES: molecular chaperone [Pantoea]|jgi:P pilus assembly chaperone PapD|uniref:Molecular chaperone n=1 Tax=Pantoea sp. BJ2 TaxID=3141322 RepID=A0AAU7U1M7_9GAMM|nr:MULTISPECIES: molecular chaperone [Pantoea]MBD9644646.1 molecular chaperone [Pantoea sp. PNT02]MBY4952816.1 molecular chaperone [Pantoea sp. DY-17]WFL69647.1 molecular chaperone [Pantoea sp. X85]